ncbi:BglG family transcription antiterminator [Brevibacillus daliensis]|uniref:BglG family transcription antiterminator n=1 Tax=Brevibacillus daliensis TaxID=2892995 RepID=UPI001E44D3E5|nr:BglG family transcription antiterminator [Brevibacillus daliensis]
MLDERVVALLQKITSSRLVTIKQLENQTKCSRRQINYDLQKINDWLTEQKLPPITNKRAQGLIVDPQVREFAKSAIPEVKMLDYIPSSEEKICIILIRTFIRTDYLSVNHFIDSLKMSRNTVLAHMKRANEFAHTFGVQIAYNRKEGYHFVGSEIDKRSLMVKCIFLLLQQKSGLNILAEIYNEEEQNESFKIAFKSMTDHLHQIEKKLNVIFVEEKMNELTAFMVILFIRICKKKHVIFPLEIKQTICEAHEHEAAKTLIQIIDMAVPEDEIAYITMQLLGLNVRYYDDADYNNKVLLNLTNEIITDFEQLACVIFVNHKKVKEALYAHLKPAYYRMLFKIPISNPYLHKIKEEHFDLFILVRKSLEKLEELVKHPISEDEVAYITLHFGSFLKEQGSKTIKRKRGIIVCPNGVGTSYMLQKQIEKLVPEIDLIKLISLREYDYSKEHEFDVVFSTVLIHTNKPLIVVNPILSALDKAQIIQEVACVMHGNKQKNPNINNLFQVIKLFATVHDESGLYEAISDALTGTIAHNIRGCKPVLKELLTKEMIQFHKQVNHWEEAIKLAAKPLLESQAIEEQYIDAMITNVNELGPYIVLAPKVAIPHARPEQGVKKVGMSFLRLEEAVSFSENDPDKLVNVIIVLAAIDSETHLRALSQLTELLEEEENIEKMIATTKVEGILPLIEEYSK